MNELECLDPTNRFVLYSRDANDRKIEVFEMRHVQVVGEPYYPGIRLFSHQYGEFYNPIRERIMSLYGVELNNNHSKLASSIRTETCPVFFFAYNVDNYYHFVYDTLPYLITYQYLKRTNPTLKILTSFANSQQNKLNKFVIEFLELLDIKKSDILIVDDKTIYETMYVSSSYTHDGKSNIPPRQEVYDLYKQITDRIEPNELLPKKIYISRRAYKHGNYDNIGTNYTIKRNFTNEGELVTFLEHHGYTEVFTELLTTKEKIALFKNCTNVIGPIGGGLCNVLFSSSDTKLTAIVSPHFLNINKRFCYSFANVNTNYFMHTENVENSIYKKYMRVYIKSLDTIGEIETIDDVNSRLGVLYSNNIVAGWNAQVQHEHTWVSYGDVEIIDYGLNSAWKIDINKFSEEFSNAQ